MNIDLSTQSHSITYIIEENHTTLDSCTTISELVSNLKILFEQNKLDTPASRRLIFNVGRSRTLDSGLQTIYNSFLCGTGNAVI